MARQTSKGNLRQKTKYVLSRSTVALIVSLLGPAGVVDGQNTTSWNPVGTTCNLRFGQGTVVGNKMFVDGGQQLDQQNYLNGTDKPYLILNEFWRQNKHLWELDLSAKFNTSKPPWTANPKPDDWNRHYNGAQGALWNLGGSTFYTFGGWMSTVDKETYYTPLQAANGSITYTYQLPPPSIHVYDTAAANWASISLPSNIRRLHNMGYAQSKRNKVGYMLGASSVVEQQDVWTNTLSAYDFKKNLFNTSGLSDDIDPMTDVVLHSLDRVGDEGVLIALAGMSHNIGGLVDYRPMDEIWIYDIASSHWMKQVAIGDIPPGRARLCSVLVPAPDLSSYQLYMFSLWQVYVLDMYVLSIPAFVWKKIDIVNYPNKWGIMDMACGLYEDRQFIIVPGEVNVSNSAMPGFFSYCNMGTAVHIFDTYDWIFKAEFDPDNKGSKVSPAIVDLIGGDEKGNAKLQQPTYGWDTKELGRVFQIRNQLPATGPNVDGGDMDESKSRSGVIAGGIVGGFVGLGFLLGLLLWWRKCQGVEQRALPELGASGYNARPPQELPAYEPPEMD